MTAFNAVRFRVKPGRDAEFLEAHRQVERDWPGMRRASMIKTGEEQPFRHAGGMAAVRLLTASSGNGTT